MAEKAEARGIGRAALAVRHHDIGGGAVQRPHLIDGCGQVGV